MNVVVLVVVIVLAALLAVGALAVLLVLVLRRMARARAGEVARAYPDAELGPEPCMYRGGTDRYPRTRNTGWLVLTPTTLVVRPLAGLEVKVPIADITGTRVEKSFNTHWNGKPVLVLETARGEVGITVRDLERWRTALVR